MEVSWVLNSARGGGGPCSAFCQWPLHADLLKVLLRCNPGHEYLAVDWHHTSDLIPGAAMKRGRRRALEISSEGKRSLPRHRYLQQNQMTAADVSSESGGSLADAAATAAANEETDGDGAERLFATARALHLRRHRSGASRDLALRLLRHTLRLRPAWRETDSRFAVDSGIDDVFKAFALESDYLGRGGSTSSSTGNTIVGADDGGGGARIGQPKGIPPGHNRSSTSTSTSTSTSFINTNTSNSTSGSSSYDTRAHADVRCIRTTLDRVGYTARMVQERLGVAGGRRLPGPYYLRKGLDHKNAVVIAAMGRPRDELDVVIRLFLLGLALPRTQAARSLGDDFLEAADRLGMLGECPVDLSLLVSLVQLFPLDAEASTLPPAPTATVVPPAAAAAAASGTTAVIRSGLPQSGGNGGAKGDSAQGATESSRSGSYSRISTGNGIGVSPSDENHERINDWEEASPVAAGNYQEENRGRQNLEGNCSNLVGAATAATSDEALRVVAASDMIFATDWPPPGSTALTEEPVMYIGPDSIGLVQHAPRARPLSPRRSHPRREVPAPENVENRRYTDSSSGRPTATLSRVRRAKAAGAGAGGHEPTGPIAAAESEQILDLCCGSGVQGIAAAVLRRGEASVTCVDINRRAARFSRFNALLNGLGAGGGGRGCFRAIVGDLYGALDSAECADGSSSSLGGGGCTNSGNNGGSDSGIGSVSGINTGTGASTGSDSNGGDGCHGSSYTPSCFDVILANPPFVPVPPKLGSMRRRYDVFAAGGADGEAVIEGVFRGAFERLRPDGGVLAVVTELANPRTFDTKLQRWVRGGSTTSASSLSKAQPPAAPAQSDCTISLPSPTESSSTPSANASAVSSATASWTGVVLHERQPWTAMEYASRRAGSPRETEGWERHLQEIGIEEMSAGFVFIRRRSAGSVEVSAPTAAVHVPSRAGVRGEGASSSAETESSSNSSATAEPTYAKQVGRYDFPSEPEGYATARSTGEIREEGHGGDPTGGGSGSVGVEVAEIEIQGIEKLWAPHNQAAIESTRAALSRL